MIDDLKPMAVFVETIEQGSFRGAAQRLQLSPSVISHHIASLEKKLGCTLIYRSTRKLSLTDEGRTLFSHAQKMLQQAQIGIDKVSPSNESPYGKLTISIPALFARSSFAHYIAEFMNIYPNISLNIQSTDERTNIIEHGVDLAVRLGELSDSSLKSVKVGNITRTLVCTPSLLEKFSPPQHPKELSNWPWLSLAMLKNTRRFIRYNETSKRVSEEYELSYFSKHTVNSVEYLNSLCIGGVGLATPPAFMVESLIANNELVHLLPEWQVLPIETYLVWPQNVLHASIPRLFIDFIKSKSMNL